MNLSPEIRTKVRGFYNSLVRQQRILEGLTGEQISSGTFDVIEQVFYNINPLIEFALPPLNRHSLSAGISFDRVGVLMWLAGATAIIESVQGDAAETNPVTEHLDFSFIAKAALRSIVERDFIEAQRAYIADCWKSVIILSGGIIETMLLDVLLANGHAGEAKCAPQGTDVRRWSLSDLINVAIELKLVEPSVAGLAQPVREYRNLVHPGVEHRKGIRPDKLEAESGLNILRIIQRDLSRASEP
jgi:hypothetical protein